MDNKRTVVIALAAGFAGSLLTRYIAPPPVFAQAQMQTVPAPGSVRAPLPNEIRAQNFTLVDQSDQVLGTFSGERRRNGTFIVLRNGDGRQIWSVGGNGLIQADTASMK